MKKNVFSFFLTTLLVTLMIIGCREEVVSPPETPAAAKSNGKIVLKASDQSSGEDLSSNGGLLVPTGIPIVLIPAAADRSNGWTWKMNFLDDGSTASGAYVIHTYQLAPPSITSIKLTGTKDNVSYDTTITVTIKWMTDGKDLVRIVGTGMRNDGLCADTLALSKERLKHLAGSHYFIKGSVTPIPWGPRVDLITSADTNYSFNSSGKLIQLPESQTGHYVRVIINTMPGKHNFGFGKVVNGVEIWMDLTGSPYVDVKVNPGLINIDIAGNGDINSNSLTLPGSIGDTGENWVVTMTPGDDTLKIYFNNFKPYPAIRPFVILLDSNGVEADTLDQLPTSGYLNSGMIAVRYLDLPKNKIISLKFGDNINLKPLVVSEYMKYSLFYDPYYREISFMIQKVLRKLSNMTGLQWAIIPAHRKH